MMLLSLKRRLEHENLSPEEKKDILAHIKRLEAAMGLNE